MFCCGNSRAQTLQKEAQMERLKNATRFTTNDLNELRKRQFYLGIGSFYRMSGGSQYLSKAQFRENLGLMGLDTVYFLSDRIFSILDDNKDDRIRFEEFVFYFDKITNGDQGEKAEISYKLIDQERIGFFTLQDFQVTMHGLIQSWVIMTGQAMQTDMQVRLDQRIRDIFNQMDTNEDTRVTLVTQINHEQIEYQAAVLKDPTLLDIFDFLKRGISVSIQEAQFKKEQIVIEEFTKIQESITSIYEFMLGEPKQQMIQTGIQVPHRMTLRNSVIPNRLSKGISYDNKKNISGVPYLLGDDDEVANQRASWVPLQQSSMMKQQNSNYRSVQEDVVIAKQNKVDTPNRRLSLQRNSFAEKPDDEDIEEGDIRIRLKVKTEQSVKEIDEKLHEKETDNKDIPQNPELKSFILESPKEVLFPQINQVSQFSARFTFDPQQQDFERNLEETIAKFTQEELRGKYKEAMIKLKTAKDTMTSAIDKLQAAQIMKERVYLEEQARKQQLIHLRIKTVANVHKSSAASRKNKSSSKKPPKKESKKNLAVHFGHENFNLVLNMMIGIQMSVRTEFAAEDLIINPRDFSLKYYFELVPKRTGQDKKETFKICKFHDYAPQVFNSIRRFFGIDNDDYVAAIGPEQMLQSLLKGDLSTLQELTSTGKSGSFFYYSADGRFTLKTIHQDEFLFLKSILRPYYEHLKKNNDTLIIKFFGMHKIYVKQANSSKEYKIYFIIMSNVFHTPYEIHHRYDLKGSLYKRSTPAELDFSVARKDLDFLKSNQRLTVDPQKRQDFLDQLKADVAFFSANNIIDYSLLVGIHHIKKNQPEKSEMSIMSDDYQEYFIPDSISVMRSLDDSHLYYFGIIDILTNFSAKKKLEYVAKRVVYGPTVSAIPPQDYAQRFYEFMTKIFDDNKVLTVRESRVLKR